MTTPDIEGAYVDTREIDSALADPVLDEDERAWWTALAEAVDETFEGFGRDGITLIRDDQFVEYAQDFARDIGAISDEYGWPYDYVDWEAAASALQTDYASIEVHGTTYWGQY